MALAGGSAKGKRGKTFTSSRRTLVSELVCTKKNATDLEMVSQATELISLQSKASSHQPCVHILTLSASLAEVS